MKIIIELANNQDGNKVINVNYFMLNQTSDLKSKRKAET